MDGLSNYCSGDTPATPAAMYAHTANRDWENDKVIKRDHCSADVNVDIARQLVEWPVGKELHVVLGGGRSNFLDETLKDEENFAGSRTDNRNLIQEWLEEKKRDNKLAKYVWSKSGLQTIDLSKTDYLWGLFSPSHCPYHGDIKRKHLEESQPSLTTMTEMAIKILRKNKEGYFLFVEGARIDMGHHINQARKSLEDTEELAKAVDLARQMTSEEDTLIVVTADHSHTMTINGYPNRKQNIFGLAPEMASDNLPYTILSYGNGPGYSEAFSNTNGRRNLFEVNLDKPDYAYMSTVPFKFATHGADDVGVFASGPYEHYFTGNYEESSIAALMANIANIGPFADDKL